MQTIDLSKMKLHELQELQMDVEKKIREVEYSEWNAKKHSKEEILAMFGHFGYQVPKGAKIWRVHPRGEKKTGGYGMEVGEYVHSCHIDTTDFKVLLVVDNNGTEHYVESFSDLWLSDCIVI